ncbi:MAG: tetratricopeptide repeat protein, partial [Acidobacteria bacterium]|nr:tetratricopeptide repeat protein [Acidobacteriota bacterium]
MLRPHAIKTACVASTLFICCGSGFFVPGSRTSARQSSGMAATSSDMQESAIAQLRAVAEGRKKDADAWYNLGLALNRAGKGKESRKAFEKAVKLRPDAKSHVGLASSLLLLNKTGDAEREARQALSLDPQFGAA